MGAPGVGLGMALEVDDPIAGSHRSHTHDLEEGASPDQMMAALLGKESWYCEGRGGSMDIAEFDTRSLGALAVVGSGIRSP